jgi:hypothetical protein
MPSRNPELEIASLEAERALLGSVLLDPKVLGMVQDNLHIEDFFSESHKTIVRHMLEMTRQEKLIDLVTLSEHLSEAGEMEKAGGPAYIAALTDGVPIGTLVAVTEYIKIIQKKSKRRNVFNVGEQLTHTALENPYQPIEEQAADAAVLLREIAEKPERKAPKQKNRYPLIPAEAWHPAAEIYRQAHSQASEASDNWHFACFYTAVGALLGRSLFTKMGRTIYPNLYSILVGLVGGDGKDTAIDFSIDFINHIDRDLYIPTEIDSRPAFIQNWQTWQEKLGEEKKRNARAVLRLVEMRSLLDKAEQSSTRSIVTMLNAAYDGPEKLSNESIMTPCEVERAHLSALMGTALRWMRGLSESDLMSGFGRRLLFWPGDPKPPMAEPEPVDEESMHNLSRVVREVVDYWHNKSFKLLGLSKAAREMWKEWYVKYKRRCVEDDLVGAMSIGDRTSARKIALINAGLDKAEQIEEIHLAPALACMEFLYNARIPIFAMHGASLVLEIENKMVELVKKANGRISKRALQQSLPRVDAKTFNERLHALAHADGPLILESGSGRVIWVTINPE